MKKFSYSAFTGVLAAILGAAAMLSTAEAAFVTVDGNITANARWTRDNVYILTGPVFVYNNAVLTIEPGTIIRGIDATLSGTADKPGFLAVTRGSKIVANGTPDAPIIFTSVDDPRVPGGSSTVPASFMNRLSATKTLNTHYGPSVHNYTPYGPNSNNGFAHNGLWGGVLLTGNAYSAQGTQSISFPYAGGSLALGAVQNDAASLGQDFLEGITPANYVPSTVPNNALLAYGGVDDADSSGVLRFVSIRYGGFVVGDGNEINSLTTGGLGSGTVLEFVECNFNQDDGFEFFGGTCNTRFLFSNYIKDDSFDADEGFRGTHQFWFAVQGSASTSLTPAQRQGWDGTLDDDGNPIAGVNGTYVGVLGLNAFDRIFEFDGAEPANAGGNPKTNISVYNATFLSAGTASGLRFREKAGGIVRSSLMEFTVASSGVFALDANHLPETVTAGNIITTGTLGNTPDATDTVGVTTGAAQQVLAKGIYTRNGIDPRLGGAVTARTENASATATPSGFVKVKYPAFQRDNTFLSGWSQLDYLDVLTTSNVARPVVTLGASGPNPTVSFTSAGAGVLYVIEKSTDRRVWTPINSETPVSGSGTISHTDTSTTFAPGTPVYYRVYAL